MGSRLELGGNHETVQGKNLLAYSQEVVAVIETISFSTAIGMAAMMTGSGTGPSATSASLTMRAISTVPFCGSLAVSMPVTFTGLPAMPPAWLISQAARSAPHCRYAPMLAIGPVRQLRKGICHSATATWLWANPGPATTSTTARTAATIHFFMRPPCRLR